MASLRSMILDGRLASDFGLSTEEMEQEQAFTAAAREQLRSREMVLVNATAVLRDLEVICEADPKAGWQQLMDFDHIPCPKPPYRNMWLEALCLSGPAGLNRVGILVGRS